MRRITEHDIALVHAQRDRLAPLAAMVGLAYNDNDANLVAVLEDIHTRRAALSRVSTKPASPGSHAPARPAELTALDQAVELMTADKEKREPAAWALAQIGARK